MIQTKQNGQRKLASISESELLRKQGGSMLQNTKRATEFGQKISAGRRKVHIFASRCLTSFLQIIIDEN